MEGGAVGHTVNEGWGSRSYYLWRGGGGGQWAILPMEGGAVGHTASGEGGSRLYCRGVWGAVDHTARVAADHTTRVRGAILQARAIKLQKRPGCRS